MNHVEIVAIGNEILKGSINNTNATEICQALFMAGFRVARQTVLSDDPIELKTGLNECLKRSRIVISTGGLGPTCDDITRQVAAELFDSGFHLDESLLQSLQRRYQNNPVSLENQSTVPNKAVLLANHLGTAPGLVFNTSESTLILLPGVPREMRAMLHDQVIPYLRHNYSSSKYLMRSLNLFNISETSVDPYLREILNDYPYLDIGIYPSHGTIKVQITADSTSNKDAELHLEKAFKRLIEVFGANRFEALSGKLEEAVHDLFLNQNWTLSVAESCTGGGISARLTKLAGASKYFLGGIVCYSNALKHALLDVSEMHLSTYGAVSKEVVLSMVEGVLKKTQSEFGLAISGIAGPDGGSPDKPVGTVWIAVAKRGMDPIVWNLRAHGNRDMIIERSINGALAGLLQYSTTLEK